MSEVLSSNIGNVKISIRVPDPQNPYKEKYLVAETKINFTKPVKKETKDKGTNLIFPEIEKVRKKDWGIGNGIDTEKDTSYMVKHEDNYTVFVNLDWYVLKVYIMKYPKEKELIENLFSQFCCLNWMGVAEEEDYSPIKNIFNKTFSLSFLSLIEMTKRGYNLK